MLSLIDEVISQSDLYKAYSHVNTIVFFIGYPRSRHSLLGSLLDAHPHMVISDETMAFNRWKARTDQWMQHSIYAYYDTMFMASHRAVSHGRRSHVFNDSVVNKSSAYGYYVPNQWQGRFDTYIEVRQCHFFFQSCLESCIVLLISQLGNLNTGLRELEGRLYNVRSPLADNNT